MISFYTDICGYHCTYVTEYLTACHVQIVYWYHTHNIMINDFTVLSKDTETHPTAEKMFLQNYKKYDNTKSEENMSSYLL